MIVALLREWSSGQAPLSGAQMVSPSRAVGRAVLRPVLAMAWLSHTVAMQGRAGHRCRSPGQPSLVRIETNDAEEQRMMCVWVSVQVCKCVGV